MKKNKLLYSLIALLVLGYGAYVFMRLAENRAFVNDTEAYLENEGYNLETDIIEMTRINIGENSPQNAMLVTFADEPDSYYFYTYRTDSEEIFLLDTRRRSSQD